MGDVSAHFGKIRIGLNIAGYYAYIEATGQSQGSRATLTSPELPLGLEGVCLEFYYHMFGPSIGSLRIRLGIGGKNMSDVV
jgi:hypothetical protein